MIGRHFPGHEGGEPPGPEGEGAERQADHGQDTGRLHPARRRGRVVAHDVDGHSLHGETEPAFSHRGGVRRAGADPEPGRGGWASLPGRAARFVLEGSADGRTRGLWWGSRETRYPYLIAAVAAISGLLFGFDTAVINGALIFLREELRSLTRGTELATSCAPGGLPGAAFAGWLTDRLGRKRILIVSGAPLRRSRRWERPCPGPWPSSSPRASPAVAIGVASVLAPLYIAEISPTAIRGRLVSLNQMAIVSGILLAYFVNWALSHGGSTSWRWMFASAAVPSAAFFVALLFVPESPRFLVETGREAEALAVLTRVGGRRSGPRRARRDPRDDRRGVGHAAGALRKAPAPAPRDRRRSSPSSSRSPGSTRSSTTGRSSSRTRWEARATPPRSGRT